MILRYKIKDELIGTAIPISPKIIIIILIMTK